MAQSERYAFLLHGIVDRAGLPSARQIALLPGMRAVHRVIMHRHDLRAADSIATLKRSGPEDAVLEVVYVGHFGHRPISRRLTLNAYQALVDQFLKLNFDRLGDQDVDYYQLDLCMVERAAGSFTRSVIFAPQKAAGVYLSLYQLIQTYMPEALREVM